MYSSAINVGVLKDLDDLEELCDLAVRALEEIIDYQKVFISFLENPTRARRSIRVGYIGLAHHLAKHSVGIQSKRAWKKVHELTEAFPILFVES